MLSIVMVFVPVPVILGAQSIFGLCWNSRALMSYQQLLLAYVMNYASIGASNGTLV
jgi:hypothetical protein